MSHGPSAGRSGKFRGITPSARTKSSGFEKTILRDLDPDNAVRRPSSLSPEAERDRKVRQGLAKGEQRSHVAVFEGAGLETDDCIEPTARRYDRNGSPLPADPDFPARAP